VESPFGRHPGVYDGGCEERVQQDRGPDVPHLRPLHSVHPLGQGTRK
jgi:hypothetical protein